ncbi:hypothetical protein CWC25_13270 [Pseudoalteromonas sp. S4389]|nr:hypothetical protein CWC25_13270 [Pseudoalteromonas sp. S4389]
MFVIYKNEQGTYSVRPAFIGFIKNNFMRRTLSTLYFPATLILTIFLNLLQAMVVCFLVILRAVFYPILKLKPIWKTEIWQRPRDKSKPMKKYD